MAVDAHKNFAYSLVATAPSPATSGTSLVVTAADGTKFPAVPFNATIWPAGVQPTTTNAEIVRVTTISTDTFTITRTQESTSARTVIVGDQIAATITAKTLTDVEAGPPTTNANLTGNVTSVGNATTIAAAVVTNAMLATATGAPGGIWNTWSPTLSGRFTDSKWNKTGRYIQIGKTIFYTLKLVANTTTPMAGGTTDARFTLPVTASGNYQGGDQNAVIGNGGIYDAGTALYVCAPSIRSDDLTLGNIRTSATANQWTVITSASPMTWTTSDEIGISGMYECA